MQEDDPSEAWGCRPQPANAFSHYATHPTPSSHCLLQGSGADVFMVQPGMSQTDFFPKMVREGEL